MTTGLYGAALEREYFTIDYDLMLKETKEESVKQGIEEGIEKGIKKGIDKGKIAILEKLLKKKYGDKCLWLRDCSKDEIDKISELIIDDISLEELKKKVFK